MSDRNEPDGVVLAGAQKKSRRRRSIAIALDVPVELFFVVTRVRGPAVLRRPF
jgi:hypothetical protein